ncbi:zinc finger protein 26-like [Culicoides brevitarsis]|uniref:zinc finger protein 26-like n=1 Tax=Culicoides brevitarsis TaxID=469753 RepID=UPI00307BAEAC
MALRCLTCDILLDPEAANDLYKEVPECKSFIMAEIYEDCLQLEAAKDSYVCDGCKVQLILFYQFKLKVAAVHLRRKNEEKSDLKSILGTENEEKLPLDRSFDEKSEENDEKSPEFNCPQCSATFLVPSALEIHIKGLHSNEKSINCIDCHQNFNTKEDLKTHQTEFHASKSFICHFCGNTFTKSSQLRVHLKAKHEKNDETKANQGVSCEICSKKLSNQSALYRHRITIHQKLPQNRPFSCEICKSRWPSRSSLENHRLSKHSGSKNFKCAICEKCFAVKYHLATHIKRVHCYTKDFVCHTCGKCFKSQNYLNSHYLVHSQDKNFSCDDCGASFKQEASLYIHKKIHRETQEGVKYNCDICEKTFRNARTLKKHQMTHNGPDLECEHCEKKYRQKDSLTKHILSVHKKVKTRVVCRICHKTMWNRGKMRSHVMEEHEEKLKDTEKTVDDYLENVQIRDERKNKRSLEIISVQILN